MRRRGGQHRKDRTLRWKPVQSGAKSEGSSAVADAEGSSAVAGGSSASSADGDSVASSSASSAAVAEDPTAAEERRQARVAPKVSRHLDPHRSRGPSSRWNAEPEVGNFGLFLGNWGNRGSVSKNAGRSKRERHDKQILRNLAQVTVLCEASPAVETLLQGTAVAGSSGEPGLEGRQTFEHWVIRGNEEENALLIAARTDTSDMLELLEYEVHRDHRYREKGKEKIAKTRMLTCKVGFKQNVGHLGKVIVVCAVHGHHHTMNAQWPEVLTEFWDRLAARITLHGVQILAGDWNMALTQVPMALRSRGIVCDCIAWHPWIHETKREHDQPLGMDSCAIFYIGGNVQVTLSYGWNAIDALTAVADEIEERVADAKLQPLQVHGGLNHPGQPWFCYRESTSKQKKGERNLTTLLQNLLWPSTSQEYLDALPRRSYYYQYLRFRQKPMDVNEWLVDGVVPNGSHFPLCVFTKNASARSKEAAERRAQKHRQPQYDKHWQNDAVAAEGSAVADDEQSEGDASVNRFWAAVDEFHDDNSRKERAAVAGYFTTREGADHDNNWKERAAVAEDSSSKWKWVAPDSWETLLMSSGKSVRVPQSRKTPQTSGSGVEGTGRDWGWRRGDWP